MNGIATQSLTEGEEKRVVKHIPRTDSFLGPNSP